MHESEEHAAGSAMMANGRELVSKALDLLNVGAVSYIERELERVYGSVWKQRARESVYRNMPAVAPRDGSVHWDTAAIIRVMLDHWQSVFASKLDTRVKTWLHELRDFRNDLAHQRLHPNDVERAIDTTQRVLTNLGAAEHATAAAGLLKVARTSQPPQPSPPRPTSTTTPALTRGRGGKYTPLGDFLRSCGKEQPELTFSEIEKLVGALPKSAREHKAAWWANHAGTHTHAKAWLAAGYRVDNVDLSQLAVRFIRG